ncbi:unnamed protein product, partial [Prorocentrum cordatum]
RNSIWEPPPVLFASACRRRASAAQIQPHVSALLRPAGGRRCLWLVGGASSAREESTRAAILAAAGQSLLFSFAEHASHSFEVVLECLEDALAAAVGEAVASGATEADVWRAVAQRHPDLVHELADFAAASAEAPTAAAASAGQSPAEVFLSLSGQVGAAEALRCVAASAEQQESPQGYLDRPSGKRRVMYLLTALEAAVASAGLRAVVAFLHVDTLTRSLFIDERGAELLGLVVGFAQHRELEQAEAPLRFVFQTDDAFTSLWALSPPRTSSVVPLTAECLDGAGTGVLVIEGDPVVDVDAGEPEDRGGKAGQREGPSCRMGARFQWQMDQVLSFPAVLELRRSHASSATAFSVVLWETLRHLCKSAHLLVPQGSTDLLHPVVQGMVHANLLEPRWGPTRLVIPSEGTRQRLVAWIESQHAKLSWDQRLEYNILAHPRPPGDPEGDGPRSRRRVGVRMKIRPRPLYVSIAP